MKTKNFIKNIIRVSLVIIAASTLAACSKDKGSNNNNSGYYMQGNQCYARSNNQPVSYQYCNGYNNNNCYQTQQYGNQQYGNQYYGNQYTQQYPNNQYCQPGGGNVIQQPCYGYFTNPQNGQQGQCYGYNCAGYMLYNQYGQAVMCM